MTHMMANPVSLLSNVLPFYFCFCTCMNVYMPKYDPNVKVIQMYLFVNLVHSIFGTYVCMHSKQINNFVFKAFISNMKGISEIFRDF